MTTSTWYSAGSNDRWEHAPAFAAEDYLEVRVYDDDADGSPMGTAMIKVLTRYREDPHGRCIDAEWSIRLTSTASGSRCVDKPARAPRGVQDGR